MEHAKALFGGAVYGGIMGFYCGHISQAPRKGFYTGLTVGVSTVAMGILFGQTGFNLTFAAWVLVGIRKVVLLELETQSLQLRVRQAFRPSVPTTNGNTF